MSSENSTISERRKLKLSMLVYKKFKSEVRPGFIEDIKSDLMKYVETVETISKDPEDLDTILTAVFILEEDLDPTFLVKVLLSKVSELSPSSSYFIELCNSHMSLKFNNLSNELQQDLAAILTSHCSNVDEDLIKFEHLLLAIENFNLQEKIIISIFTKLFKENLSNFSNYSDFAEKFLQKKDFSAEKFVINKEDYIYTFKILSSKFEILKSGILECFEDFLTNRSSTIPDCGALFLVSIIHGNSSKISHEEKSQLAKSLIQYIRSVESENRNGNPTRNKAATELMCRYLVYDRAGLIMSSENSTISERRKLKLSMLVYKKFKSEVRPGFIEDIKSDLMKYVETVETISKDPEDLDTILTAVFILEEDLDPTFLVKVLLSKVSELSPSSSYFIELCNSHMSLKFNNLSNELQQDLAAILTSHCSNVDEDLIKFEHLLLAIENFNLQEKIIISIFTKLFKENLSNFSNYSDFAEKFLQKKDFSAEKFVINKEDYIYTFKILSSKFEILKSGILECFEDFLTNRSSTIPDCGALFLVSIIHGNSSKISHEEKSQLAKSLIQYIRSVESENRNGNPTRNKAATELMCRYLVYAIKHSAIAIILHNDEWPDVPQLNRPGSKQDMALLKDTFEKLLIPALIIQNPSNKQIEEVFDEMKVVDFSQIAYLILGISTHGTAGDNILIKDGLISPDNIVQMLVNKNPTLKNVKKIMFVQACKAPPSSPENQQTDDGDYEDDSVGLGNPIEDIPLLEYFRLNSTSEGLKSYRKVKTGTFFINALMDTILKYGKEKSLTEISKITIDKVKEETRKYKLLQVPSEDSNTLSEDIVIGDSDIIHCKSRAIVTENINLFIVHILCLTRACISGSKFTEDYLKWDRLALQL